MKNDMNNEGVITPLKNYGIQPTPKNKVVGSHGTVSRSCSQISFPKSQFLKLFSNRKKSNELFGPASSGGRGLPQDARNLAAGSCIGTR